jgi:hypothetical protein
VLERAGECCAGTTMYNSELLQVEDDFHTVHPRSSVRKGPLDCSSVGGFSKICRITLYGKAMTSDTSDVRLDRIACQSLKIDTGACARKHAHVSMRMWPSAMSSYDHICR